MERGDGRPFQVIQSVDTVPGVPGATSRTTDAGASAASAESRLIATAERLFADHGVGAVSLRTVMNEAGTHVAAVHYHFGSKQALLKAVVSSRLEQIVSERSRIVSALPVSDKVTVRDLAEALVRPAVVVLRTGGEHWLRLLNRLLGSDYRDLSEVSEGFLDRNSALVGWLGLLNPGVPQTALNFRLAQAMSITLDVLSDIARTRTLMSSQDHEWTTEDVIGNLLDFVTAVLAGPPADSKPGQPPLTSEAS